MAHTRSHDETQRYRRAGLLESELIYGSGYQSPGGEDAVSGFAAGLGLEPGMRVLDVGSGTGGAARYLARTFGVEVVGVDSSADCVDLATERAEADGLDGVSFVQMDARSLTVDAGSFDLVWSRDTLVCIEDKAAVFQGMHRALRPGGSLFVTDFCARPAVSAGFDRYVRLCGWSIATPDEHRRALVAAGFHGVLVQDVSTEMVGWMRLELDRLDAGVEEFVGLYGKAAYVRMRERWTDKLRFCETGDLVWAKLTARRVEP